MGEQRNASGRKDIVPVKKINGHKSKKGLAVFIIVIAAAVISSAVAVIGALESRQFTIKASTPHRPDAMPDASSDESDFERIFGKNILFKSYKKKMQSDYIAVIHIIGVIEDENKTYNQSWLLNTIDDLAGDDYNKAIMLYINSPGGGVYQADAVYLSLEAYKENTGRPIYAYMGPLAASGGYYIACAAQKIYANRNTLTGSIGVIAAQSIDATDFLSKLGLKSTTITAGKNKNMMNYNSPLTEEQKAIMQAVADEAYDQFVSIVSKSRSIDEERVRTLADGRIYTARQSVKNNLIDDVCEWDEALDKLKEQEGLGSDCSVEHYRTEEKLSLYEYMRGAASSVAELSAAIKEGTLFSFIDSTFSLHVPYPAYYYAH